MPSAWRRSAGCWGNTPRSASLSAGSRSARRFSTRPMRSASCWPARSGCGAAGHCLGLRGAGTSPRIITGRDVSPIPGLPAGARRGLTWERPPSRFLSRWRCQVSASARSFRTRSISGRSSCSVRSSSSRAPRTSGELCECAAGRGGPFPAAPSISAPGRPSSTNNTFVCRAAASIPPTGPLIAGVSRTDPNGNTPLRRRRRYAQVLPRQSRAACRSRRTSP